MAKSEPAQFISESYCSCFNESIMHKRVVTIHEPLPGRVASDSKLHEIIAKLRNVARIDIATGYQDETGFHLGVKLAENEIKWPPVW
jgi:hypothetical protein